MNKPNVDKRPPDLGDTGNGWAATSSRRGWEERHAWHASSLTPQHSPNNADIISVLQEKK